MKNIRGMLILCLLVLVKAVPQASASAWCGGHGASSCSQCPQGHGAAWHGRAWCNGECQWCGGWCQPKIQCAVPLTWASRCGTNIPVTENGIYIDSTSYDHNLDCTWVINRDIPFKIRFNSFHVEYESRCNYDYLRIDGGYKRCGNSPQSEVLSKRNSMRVEFHTDHSAKRPGFQLQIIMLPVVKISNSGKIRSQKNGRYHVEGKAEVYRNGHWGNICADYFNQHSANIACRAAGYDGGSYSTHADADGTKDLRSDLKCYFFDNKIADCNNGKGISWAANTYCRIVSIHCNCKIGYKDQGTEICFGHRCNGIDGGCCTADQPCYEGDGDCDEHDQCAGSLVCGRDNCVGSGFDNTDDCCTKPENARYSSQPQDVRGQQAQEGCFPSTALLRRNDGSQVTMNDVRVGDKLLAITDMGEVTYSEVTMMMHKDSDATLESYVRISTGSNRSMVMSLFHLLPVYVNGSAHKSFIYGKDVQPFHHYVATYDAYTMKVSLSIVVSVTDVSARGMFAPLTDEGTIVVDDVHASCYAYYPYHTHAHRAFLFWRYLYRILSPQLVGGAGEGGIHWYPDFLQKLVKSLPFLPSLPKSL